MRRTVSLAAVAAHQLRNSTASRRVRLEPKTETSPSATSSTPSQVSIQSRPVIGRLSDEKVDRRGRRNGGGNRIAWGRRGRRKRLHVDLARRAVIGREPIGLEVFD